MFANFIFLNLNLAECLNYAFSLDYRLFPIFKSIVKIEPLSSSTNFFVCLPLPNVYSRGLFDCKGVQEDGLSKATR